MKDSFKSVIVQTFQTDTMMMLRSPSGLTSVAEPASVEVTSSVFQVPKAQILQPGEQSSLLATRLQQHWQRQNSPHHGPVQTSTQIQPSPKASAHLLPKSAVALKTLVSIRSVRGNHSTSPWALVRHAPSRLRLIAVSPPLHHQLQRASKLRPLITMTTTSMSQEESWSLLLRSWQTKSKTRISPSLPTIPSLLIRLSLLIWLRPPSISPSPPTILGLLASSTKSLKTALRLSENPRRSLSRSRRRSLSRSRIKSLSRSRKKSLRTELLTLATRLLLLPRIKPNRRAREAVPEFSKKNRASSSSTALTSRLIEHLVRLSLIWI